MANLLLIRRLFWVILLFSIDAIGILFYHNSNEAYAFMSEINFKNYYEKGNYYIAHKNFIEAIPYLRKAIELKPNHVEANSNLGLCYYKINEYDEAIKYYQKAIHLKPDYALAYYGLGLSYGKKGNYSESLSHFKKYLGYAKNIPEQRELVDSAENYIKQLEKIISQQHPNKSKSASPSVPTDTVELYITSWCPVCQKAINFFKTRGIPVNIYDVEKDTDAARRKKALADRPGVPFAIIYGQKFVGFSEEKYQAALNSKKDGSRKGAVPAKASMTTSRDQAITGGLVREANVGREGQEFDISTLPVAGKYTILDFYSPFCPPCREIAPFLEKLAANRDDVVVFKLNINRPNVKGIDRSPLVYQYQIRSVPYFMIFNPQKKLIAKGPEARQLIEQWISER